jgi:uncharacterized Zn finger protein (UPF0148 family)
MNHCPHCRKPYELGRLFCSNCNKLLEPRSLTVRTSTDDSRGRALDEMRATVEDGRAEYQREVESRFERDVYEHYRDVV